MTKKLTFKIDGMHCTSCAMSIDGDLEDFVNGVKSSNTNYAKSETEVEIEENANIEEIVTQIGKTGYRASLKN